MNLAAASPASAADSAAPAASVPGVPDADSATVHTLLNCLLREVSGPEHQATVADGHLLIRLPRADALLRVAVRRTSLTGAHRFDGPVRRHTGTGWATAGWRELAELISRELELRSGIGNDEFTGQVQGSRDTVAALLDRRPALATADRYLESEQALFVGHRFHPAPKAHGGRREDRIRYRPEAGEPVALRLFGIRADAVREREALPGGSAVLDGLADAPDGYRILPVHPWQAALLDGHPVLHAALADGRMLDLGSTAPEFAPTASVRTLAVPGGGFLKFSLDVRITNCVRKNAAYELDGAVALTGILASPAAATAARHPGFALLPEPAYRAADFGDTGLLEGLGVIVRDGTALTAGPGTPLLAAAVADEYPFSAAHVSRLIPQPTADAVTDWFAAYVRLLVPPVLTLFFEHGVVLEPHLQNVLVCVADDGTPVRMLFRDLEGTKLVGDRHGATLAALPAAVAGPMEYDRERGWNRVVYCLLVNHLGETAAALADLCPGAEPRLWGVVRNVLLDHARAYGCPPPLRALLSGVPLPAKANLLTRWRRAADREAGYVPLPSPLGAAFLHGAEEAEPWTAR